VLCSERASSPWPRHAARHPATMGRSRPHSRRLRRCCYSPSWRCAPASCLTSALPHRMHTSQLVQPNEPCHPHRILRAILRPAVMTRSAACDGRPPGEAAVRAERRGRGDTGAGCGHARRPAHRAVAARGPRRFHPGASARPPSVSTVSTGTPPLPSPVIVCPSAQFPG
jgi:hypothetical protein